MTEAEWRKSVNSKAMLAVLRGKGSERLWRLYAVACVRTVDGLLRYDGSRNALGVAERFADGAATREELRAARAQAEAAAEQAHRDEWEDEVRANFCVDEKYEAVCQAMQAADAVLPCVADEVDGESVDEGLRLPNLLREVFGNPFQWKQAEPIGVTSNDGAAWKLARTIYENRAFDLLPILADALEDAGCNDADLLAHLRSPGLHVRGCWALDLILGKE